MSTIRPDVSRVWATNAPSANIQDPDKFVPGKVLKGWEAEIPPFQWFNWLQNINDSFLKALAERGISSWGDDITYAKGALAFLDDDGLIYVSLKENKAIKPSLDTQDTWVVSGIQVTRAEVDAIKALIETHQADERNPHKVTAEQLDAYTKAAIDAKIQAERDALEAHESDYSNSHKVTAAQAGGVPITGGTYDGQINTKANKFQLLKDVSAEEVGIISESDGIALMKGNARLGLDNTDTPYFNGDDGVKHTLLPESKFEEKMLEVSPEYAVPTPDFHMPLTSDINIYQGIGESEFSRATGATYIDKMGILRTAGIDELRFEKDGLLIEGSSTNLIPESNPNTVGVRGSWYYWSTVRQDAIDVTEVLPNGVGGVCTQFTQKQAGYLRLRHSTDRTNTYACSIFIKGLLGSFSIRGVSVSGYTDSVTKFEADGSLISQQGPYKAKCVKLSNGWLHVSMYDSDATDAVAIEVMDGETWLAWGGQVEDLPFASSYIPTNGTPVTRAADTLLISASENPLPLNGDYSVSVYSDRFGDVGDYSQEIYRVVGSPTTLLRATSRGGTEAYVGGTSISTSSTGSLYSVVASSTFASLYVDGELKSSSSIASSQRYDSALTIGRNLYGHIKNLRVWNEALTPEQISTL